MTYEPPVTDYDYIVENCTCAFCGCNCDDLDYLVKNNHVVAVRHACRLGASKIMDIAIISTNKGIMTDKEARALNVGGEVLAFIW